MPKLQDLADRVDRLLLRHQELQRTNALLEQQRAQVVVTRPPDVVMTRGETVVARPPG